GAYNRVIAAYKRALLAVIAVSTVFFACFQLFPREIAGIFVNRGSGLFIENGELFMRFSERYIRIFLLMIALQGLQPLTATFFTSIGKAFKGLFITVTRQGVFMLPLFVILPKYFGIDGLIYAGPIADAAAIIMAILFAALEFRTMSGTEASRRP
ncbi:MAG: MATE family efflux transporter, partial [Clostridiales bacterium]|nr:MATE family efflux transporter [Clostridiales bacterium]